MLAGSGALTRSRAQIIALLTPAALVIALDHLTKWLVSQHLVVGQEYPQGWPVVLRHIENSGAAFGLFNSLTWFYPLVAVVVAVLIVAIGPRYAPATWQQVVLGAILGGALSNAIDRVLFHHVTDFIDFRVWPVFNVADIAITLGIATAILFFRSVKSETHHEAHAQEKGD